MKQFRDGLEKELLELTANFPTWNPWSVASISIYGGPSGREHLRVELRSQDRRVTLEGSASELNSPSSFPSEVTYSDEANAIWVVLIETVSGLDPTEYDGRVVHLGTETPPTER